MSCHLPYKTNCFFSKDLIAWVCIAALWGSVVFFAGCTAAPLMNARKEFYSNDPLKAADSLSELRDFPSNDKLLLFMEKGLIQHHLGRYEESINEFFKASKLIEEQETISLSRQSLSLVTTDWITQYKGEYSERLWVHTYLMMNFLLLHKYESALVEAKKALKVLEKHPESLADDYFTRALIALCYENLGQTNDAYIEYKKLAGLMHSPYPVAGELYRLGSQLGFTKEAEHYKKVIPKSQFALLKKKPAGELILFVGVGTGPVKVSDDIIAPASIRFSFPRYESRGFSDAQIIVSDSGQRLPAVSVTTSIDKVASASLQARASKIVVKETARAAIKEAMAQAVEHKNESVIGVLLRAALFLMEEADTRCWETLPASLKLIRLRILRPGKHHFKVTVVRGRGIVEEITLPEISVSSGRKIYHSIRVNN
ncbi:tetratricopeptide repeat-containing [Desulfonema magnum]|uniref:Tetratricopeptide repeat-containing n=1 Tax=Desulfonema magnum TaxID=45655 RepID=A0A975BUU1_9BACT|nr:tetratricopeptide repeat-containing [Desulfonema magnum]